MINEMSYHSINIHDRVPRVIWNTSSYSSTKISNLCKKRMKKMVSQLHAPMLKIHQQRTRREPDDFATFPSYVGRCFFFLRRRPKKRRNVGLWQTDRKYHFDFDLEKKKKLTGLNKRGLIGALSILSITCTDLKKLDLLHLDEIVLF